MPNITVKIPEGLFSLSKLAQGLTTASKTVEQIGDDPRHLFTSWVSIEEVKADSMFAAGDPALGLLIPAVVQFHYPAGVLDDAARALAAKLFHAAVVDARIAPDARNVHTSLIMSEVPDGSWGVSGAISRLPDFARTAGYKHLQHLVSA